MSEKVCSHDGCDWSSPDDPQAESHGIVSLRKVLKHKKRAHDGDLVPGRESYVRRA